MKIITSLFILTLLTTSSSFPMMEEGGGAAVSELEKPTEDQIKLLEAVKAQNVEATRRLLEAKVNPNFAIRRSSSLWESPLSLASRNGSFDIAQLLLDNGWQVDEVKIKEFVRNSPLLEATRIFLEDWISPVEYRQNFQKIIYLLLGAKADPNSGDRYGKTPFMLVAKYGPVEMIRKFLQSGASVNRRDRDGENALFYAAERKDHAAAVMSLIIDPAHNNGEEVDINTKNRFGNTSLHRACRRGCLENVQYLLEAKANPNIFNNDGKTALHEVIYIESYLRDERATDLVRALLIGSGEGPIYDEKGKLTNSKKAYNGADPNMPIARAI